MILLSATIVAKKLLVDDKITACVKEICLMGVVCKVSHRKTLPGEKFYFNEKRLLSKLNFCAPSNLCFFFCKLLIAHNQLSWNELLFSCNPIGELCLHVSDPGYSSRTVTVNVIGISHQCGNFFGAVI